MQIKSSRITRAICNCYLLFIKSQFFARSKLKLSSLNAKFPSYIWISETLRADKILSKNWVINRPVSSIGGHLNAHHKISLYVKIAGGKIIKDISKKKSEINNDSFELNKDNNSSSSRHRQRAWVSLSMFACVQKEREREGGGEEREREKESVRTYVRTTTTSSRAEWEVNIAKSFRIWKSKHWSMSLCYLWPFFFNIWHDKKQTVLV